MKGILRKTNIWQVEYQVINSFRFLPLHPDDVSSIMMNADSSVGVLDGIEVEFEIVKEYIDAHTNQVQEYALINGYYQKPIEIPYKDVMRAASDWVDENGHKWSNNTNEVGDNYGSFMAGAAWYQEQLKKK